MKVNNIPLFPNVYGWSSKRVCGVSCPFSTQDKHGPSVSF